MKTKPSTTPPSPQSRPQKKWVEALKKVPLEDRRAVILQAAQRRGLKVPPK